MVYVRGLVMNCYLLGYCVHPESSFLCVYMSLRFISYKMEIQKTLRPVSQNNIGSACTVRWPLLSWEGMLREWRAASCRPPG